jgi:hypothetical protein
MGVGVPVAVGAVCALIGAKAAHRDFGHYFVQAVPWLGLLTGLVLERPAESRPGRRLAGAVPILVSLVALVEVQWPPVEARHRQQAARAAVPAVCALVQAHAGPRDPVFMWGFWTELYTLCARRPATRFVYTTMPAGVVPWFCGFSPEQDEALAVPGSRRQLLADLEASQAPVIVDAPATLCGRPMRRYGPLAAYLDQHYASVGTVDGAEVLVRDKTARRVLFDFEDGALTGWATTGEAFQQPIATASRRGQAAVTGPAGTHFVDSFAPGSGDTAVGTATSPPFVVDRSRLGLLVGGGGSARVALQVGGQLVLTAQGSRRELLGEVVWDVSRYRGARAQLVLIDDDRAPWGHLLVDRIELFDRTAPGAP